MNYLKRKIIARFVVFLTVVMVVFWSVPCNFAFGEVQEGSALTDTPESEQSETTDITTEVTVETTEESTDETIEETATETTDESSDSEESQEGEESQENEKAAEEEPATEETEETVSDSTGIEATLLPDTTLPVITIIGGSPVMVEPGSVFVDAGATAIDDVDGDLTGCVEVISTVDAAVPGSYKVTYNVSDAAGNAAAEVTRIVNVAGKPTVATDKDDYSPGEIVVVTGSGWLPGETIKLDFAILPLQLTLTYYATADGEGNIYNNEYMIFEHHLGQTIVLTATGQTTGLSAVTIFTDSPKIGSVTVGTQSPIAVYPTANATFTITVRRGSGTGSSGAFTANLSILTVLPPGCTASFNPTVVSFTSGNTSKTSTLTISTTSGSTPIGISSFTVKAEVSGTPADYATGDGTLKVGGVASVTAGSQTPNPVYTPNSTAYAVTVNRGGGTGPFSADLSVTTALPDGCTYSFSPSTVSFSSGDTSKTSTLTVSTSSFTPAGSTSFTIRATNSDNSNDYKTGSRTLAVVRDTTAPKVTLTAYLPDPTTDNTPFYSGSAADTYTNIVDIGYCIDSGSWANVDAFTPAKNVSFTFTTPALTDGLHTIYVRAYDAAGNISATVSDILTVNTPPTITGQPSDATKTIGESVTFSVAASGTAPLSYQWRKCGDNISGATSSSYTIPSVVPGDAGSYDVVVSNPYGSVTSNTAALTVNPITTTLSVSPVSGTYGGTVDLSATLSLAVSGKTISFTLNGTSAGSAITDASGVATLSGISLSGIDAGLYPAGVSTSFADDSNYIASSDSDSLTVTPALLTITANDASKAYGSPNPAFSATYSGFVAGDDESDLNGSLSITTPAGDTSPVGTYPITPSRLSSDNYNITFVDGTLIITAVTAAVTDTDNPDSKLEEENIVEVSGETSDINVQALTITADDDSDENLLDYTIAVNNKTLITTADLTADDEAEPTITVAGITSSGAIEVSEFTRLSPIILISGFCIVAIGLIVLFIHLSRMMKPRKLVIFWLKMMR